MIRACGSILLLTGLLIACSTTPPATPPAQVEDFKPARPVEKPKVRTYGIDLEKDAIEQSRQTLSSEPEPPLVLPEPEIKRDLALLFELEIAAQRGDNKEELLDRFIAYAITYQDVKVAERSYELAQEIHSSGRSLTTARLWYDLDPDSNRSQEIYIKELILQSQYQEAFKLMELRHLQGERTDFRLMAIFAQLGKEAEGRQLIQIYQDYINSYPELTKDLTVGLQHSRYQLAKFLFYQNQLKKSLRLFNLILSSPTYEDQLREIATVFKARIYYLVNQPASNSFYDQALIEFPTSIQIPIFYSLLLLKQDDTEQASQVLSQAFDQALQGGDEQKVFLLAHLSQQVELDEVAEQILEYYQSQVSQQDDAAKNLGLLAMTKGAYSLAEDFFQLLDIDSPIWHSVQLWRLRNNMLAEDLDAANHLLEEVLLEDEDFYFSIAGEYALELAEADLGDMALAVLDEAERKRPYHRGIKMIRALVYLKLNQPSAMIEQFERLMAESGNDVGLLNDFGYSLADMNVQLERAKAMIEEAVARQPNNSAYIDSLGWVNYRLNNLPRAYELLNWAYSSDQNGEIAAHLGEVLWRLGEKARARLIWLSQYERQPYSTVLIETMSRFKVDRDKLAPHIPLIHPNI